MAGLDVLDSDVREMRKRISVLEWDLTMMEEGEIKKRKQMELQLLKSELTRAGQGRAHDHLN